MGVGEFVLSAGQDEAAEFEKLVDAMNAKFQLLSTAINGPSSAG